MAPTSVFSYFRNHRRTGSSPLLSQSPGFQNASSPKAPPSPARSEFATSSTAGRLDASPSLQSLQPISKSSPIPAQPPVLPPIQRVASVYEAKGHEVGSIRRRPKGVRSTTSPVLPSESPRRWVFEDVPEEESEEEIEMKTTSIAGVGLVDERNMSAPLSLDTTISSLQDVTSEERRKPKSDGENTKMAVQPSGGQKTASGGLHIDFDDNFRLHSLDLRDPTEDSPISPTQPAPMIQSRKRSPSPKKHWALPPLAAASNILPFKSIPDDNGSSGSSVSSVNRSSSAVTLNPDPTSFVHLSPVTTLKPTRQRKSILNPMSLLTRRRTSQGLDQDAQMDFAPFGTVIRGQGVHDFDKPRPRRHLSTNDLDGYSTYSRGDVSPVEEYKRRADIPWSTAETSVATTTDTSRRQSEQGHLPIFKEDFDSDAALTESALRREDLVNQDFLKRAQESVSGGSRSRSPPRVSERVSDSPQIQVAQSEPIEGPVRSTTPNPPAINIIEGTPIPNTNAHTFPELMPSSDAITVPQSGEQNWQLETPQPRLHRPSEASDTSRFSFIPGDPSAEEEKKLEQRHMERASREQMDRPNANHDTQEEEEDEESDPEYVSDYGEEGSFYNEESIPEVGGDIMLDDDQTVRRDVNLPTSSLANSSHQPSQPVAVPLSVRPMQHGLGLDLSSFPSYMQEQHFDENKHPTPEDDMYYDDGLIGEPSPLDDDTFDESTFDHDAEEGQALSPPGPQQGPLAQSEELPVAGQVEQKPDTAESKYLDPHDSATGEDGDITPVKRSSKQQHHHVDTPMHQSKLDAYHSALATVTARAEAHGRFNNDDAMSPLQRYSFETSQGGGSSDASQYPEHDFTQSVQDAPIYWQPSIQDDDQPYWQDNGYDDFDPSFDFNSDDIAAANAEALAADDSGFYGREFSSFFGNTPNSTGLNRNKSLREPILTPITERSEFSRAPSFMSMGSPLFGPPSFAPGPQGSSPGLPSIPFNSDGFLHPSSPALQSPALRELASRVGLNQEEMTLKQLMKLRQDALGTAGLSPVMAHFNSPNSPNLGAHGPGAASGSAALLSPHVVGTLPSSPLAGRSANLPTSSPQSVKIGSVPEAARRRSTRGSSLGTAMMNSSPPRVESPGSASGGYFAPDSPSSAFSYTADPHDGLGITRYDHQEYDENVVKDQEDETDYDQFDTTNELEESTISQQPNLASRRMSIPLHAPATTTSDGVNMNQALRSHPISSADLLSLGEAPLDSRTATPVPAKQSLLSMDDLSPLPSPPPSLLSKFAGRPPASSKTFEEREAERAKQLSTDQEDDNDIKGVESVAYIQDKDDAGNDKWYVEKRKTLGSGEVVVLGREEVVGGKI